jgi:hypothetical protein
LKRVPKDGPVPHRFTLISGFLALSRMAVTLGILDHERREFWRFVRRAVSEHREKFAVCMRLAAMGYHFRKLAEAYG